MAFFAISPPLFFLSLLIISSTFFSCSSKDKVKERKSRDAGLAVQKEASSFLKKKTAALDSFFSSLSKSERLAQLFVVNLEGKKEFSFVEWIEEGGEKKPLIPGGYIFFSFNISKKPEEIAAFTDSVREFAAEHGALEPFLCLDAEGGYVNRLRGVAGPLPENKWISKNLSVEDASFIYSLNAVQLRSLGFDLNLSPVVEVQNESNKEFLNGRSYGSARAAVGYGSAALLACQKNGVAAVLKHFPGNNSVDPHLALPLLDYDYDEFFRDVLEPFAILARNKPKGVLMSHALVRVQGFSKDNEVPASLSPFWIKETLRGRAAFDGLVFSDDIFMAALEKNGYPSERAVKSAVLAGVNCILMSEKRFLNEWTIVKKLYDGDEKFRTAADDSAKRILAFKLWAGILEWNYKKNEITAAKSRASLPGRLEAFYEAKKLNEEALKDYVQE